MATANDDDASSYEPEYEQERVQIGSISLHVLSVIPPPLEFMSQLHSQQQEISGRQVWTGSLLLAHVLYDQVTTVPGLFSNQRILELGSGTGILGMAISKLPTPPACLVLTDGDPQAVNLLQANLDNPLNQIDSSLVTCRQLLWGDSNSMRAMKAWYCCHQSRLKHRWKDGQEVTFDAILAGDVLYKAELPKLFFQTARDLLERKQGVLWLCHVPRASVTQGIVVAVAKQAGFRVETISIDHMLPVQGCPLEDASRARVYRMTLEPFSSREL